jgi:hypothetical protein
MDCSTDGPTVFGLDGADDSLHTLVYDASAANDFHATYAYNNDRARQAEPICDDLMMRFFVRADKPASSVGVSLEKDQVHYIARVRGMRRWLSSMTERHVGRTGQNADQGPAEPSRSILSLPMWTIV